MKKIESCLSMLQDNKKVIFAIFLIALTFHSQGFCSGAAALTQMDNMATTTINTIFSPWVRKTVLAFGAGLGLFQSVAGGSFKPLITWGGLGLVVNYVPKLIEFFTSLGT